MISDTELGQRGPLYRRLASTTIGSLFPGAQTVVKINANDSIKKAMQILADHKILSAPVVDSAKGYLGFVDTLDIVTYIVKGAGASPNVAHRTASELTSFGDEAVSKIIGISDRDPFEPLESSTPAHALIELFALGIHRIPIIQNGEITHIISQSTLCKYLLDQGAAWNEVGSLFGVASGSSRNLGDKLATVKRTDTVLEVLKHIDQALVSSVPVVDENGAMIASFSSSDLRGVFGDSLASLTLSIEEYLKKHSTQAFHPLTGDASEPSSALISKMLNSAPHRRHRVWIVESATKKPVGVFSMTDAMKLIRDATN